MRPPPALALAALCLLALPAAVAAAYFGLVPAAPPAGAPSPPVSASSGYCRANFSLHLAPAAVGSRTQTLALVAPSPTLRSDVAPPALSLASPAQTPTAVSSVPFSGPLRCRSFHDSLSETSPRSLRPISDPCPSSRTMHASRTLTPFALERRVPACPGVAPAR